jgi:hypothetical protein
MFRMTRTMKMLGLAGLLGLGMSLAAKPAAADAVIGFGFTIGAPAPQPVVVAPPPVVYAPAPVVVAPPPAVYAPAPVYAPPMVYGRYYSAPYWHHDGYRHREHERWEHGNHHWR